MRSSVDKRRDMARSILSSKTRTPGWFITQAKRRSRRRMAQHLHVAKRVPGDWDDELDAVDLRAYPDAEIHGYVRWRRGADKLNHFERWAVRSTRHLPVDERLGALRSTLPRGLVGDHAMSHLRDLPELNPAVGVDGNWSSHALRARHRAWEAEERAREARAAERRRARVLDLLAHGGHAALNRAMKAAACGDPPRWRTLADVRALDAFLADVAGCTRWQAALVRFLDTPTR